MREAGDAKAPPSSCRGQCATERWCMQQQQCWIPNDEDISQVPTPRIKQRPGNACPAATSPDPCPASRQISNAARAPPPCLRPCMLARESGKRNAPLSALFADRSSTERFLFLDVQPITDPGRRQRRWRRSCAVQLGLSQTLSCPEAVPVSFVLSVPRCASVLPPFLRTSISGYSPLGHGTPSFFFAALYLFP